ncbi:MAG: glycosyltransferase [Candidatus Sumerlaeia bacterium]|nr:glycosyltransferase [Candidatus Sumerlaeia bacterium]
MKKVLIITYDFPPDAMGVRRIVKFCQYLPELGWQPLVLTVKAKRGIKDFSESLTILESKGVKIFRSGSADPYRLAYLLRSLSFARSSSDFERSGQLSSFKKSIVNFCHHWLFVPDELILWVPFAVVKGFKILKHEKPQLIFTTSYPSSTHLIGLILKRLSNIKWVADFRDGWLQNKVFYKPPTFVHQWLQEKLELMVAEGADLIIGVTDAITNYFARLTGNREKCQTITNGFDPDDFLKIEPKAFSPRERMHLLYTGTLFEPRRADSLLQGLKILLDEKPYIKNQILLHFFSVLDDRTLKLITDLGINDIVKVEKFKPYSECLAYQKGADVLVLIISPGENAQIMMTQKVFEYLAAGRPILGIMPDSPCKSLIQSLNAGKVVSYDDINGIKHAIAEFYTSWCKGKCTGVPMNAIKDYTRYNLTKKLSDFFDKLVRK